APLQLPRFIPMKVQLINTLNNRGQTPIVHSLGLGGEGQQGGDGGQGQAAQGGGRGLGGPKSRSPHGVGAFGARLLQGDDGADPRSLGGQRRRRVDGAADAGHGNLDALGG